MAEQNKSVSCPACGSSDVDTRTEKREIPIPLASAAVYEAVVNVCRVCETAGDFAKVNDKAMILALDAAKKSSLSDLICQIVEKNKMSMAYMERALDLPARTMMRWKSGEVSAGALALMRIVATYPWTVEVADERYDPAFAMRSVAQAGFNAMAHLAKSQNISTRVVVSSKSAGCVEGKFELTQSGPAKVFLSSGAADQATINQTHAKEGNENILAEFVSSVA